MKNGKETDMKNGKRALALLLGLALGVAFLCLGNPARANAETLVWPVPGHTSLSRGYSSGHPAIDISDGGIEGAAVVAAHSGTVRYVFTCGQQHYGSDHTCHGFGTGVVVYGEDGRSYQYAHMQAGSIPSNVYNGAHVGAGQQLGRVGKTGNATGPHLHFGIANGSQYWVNLVNPMGEAYRYDGGPTPTAPTVKWVTCASYPMRIWDTNAMLSLCALATGRGTFTGAGITVWDGSGNVVARKDESPSITGSYMDVYYNVHDELGATLRPGTRYTYRFWCRFNGQTYQSDTLGFTTTGQAPAAYEDMYRLYNRWTGEHLFTSSASEASNLRGLGWSYEGVAWHAPLSGTAVYRLYNPYSGDHFYTTSASEYRQLGGIGWRQEGVAFHSAGSSGVPVYRLFNRWLTQGTHLFTTSASEYRQLGGIGWRQEGVAWYGLRA